MKNSEIKRRFGTLYIDPHDKMIAHGAASTIRGAIAATVPRIFLKEYGSDVRAIIRDRELEINLVVITAGRNGLDAVFTPEAKAAERGMRRIK